MAAGGFEEAHERVRAAAAAGAVADFARDGDPEEPPPYGDDGFWAGRTLDGAWLADFLCDASSPKHRRGVRVIGARIVGGLDLSWATLDGPVLVARCQLGSHPILLLGANTRSVSFAGTVCGGVTGDGVDLSGSMFLRDGFAATGEVRLPGATIGGDLDCSDGTFTNPDGDALSLDSARITGGVFLNNGFAVTGGVRLLGANVGSALDCSDGTFTNPDGDALSLDRARITGGVFLNNGFAATGTVRLLGATIGGDVACRNGTFTNPDGDALSLDGASITGSVFLTDGFAATGEVRLLGATIDGNLACRNATFTNSTGDALSADNASVRGAMMVRGGTTFDGTVGLPAATVGALADDKASWPQSMDLDGFTYGRLYSPHRSWKERAEWLRRQVAPTPHSYLHLATVYRASGDERPARKILMERHNTLLHPPQHWTVPTGWRGRLGRAWRRFLRYTIGHGYEPWRVLWFAVPLLVGMAFWYDDARDEGLLVPTRPATTVEVEPVVYALDTLLPLVDLKQRSEFVPDQGRRNGHFFDDGWWLAVATWTTSLLGWVFATLVAASFTQVVRRE